MGTVDKTFDDESVEVVDLENGGEETEKKLAKAGLSLAEVQSNLANQTYGPIQANAIGVEIHTGKRDPTPGRKVEMSTDELTDDSTKPAVLATMTSLPDPPRNVAAANEITQGVVTRGTHAWPTDEHGKVPELDPNPPAEEKPKVEHSTDSVDSVFAVSPGDMNPQKVDAGLAAAMQIPTRESEPLPPVPIVKLPELASTEADLQELEPATPAMTLVVDDSKTPVKTASLSLEGEPVFTPEPLPAPPGSRIPDDILEKVLADDEKDLQTNNVPSRLVVFTAKAGAIVQDSSALMQSKEEVIDRQFPKIDLAEEEAIAQIRKGAELERQMLRLLKERRQQLREKDRISVILEKITEDSKPVVARYRGERALCEAAEAAAETEKAAAQEMRKLVEETGKKLPDALGALIRARTAESIRSARKNLETLVSNFAGAKEMHLLDDEKFRTVDTQNQQLRKKVEQSKAEVDEITRSMLEPKKLVAACVERIKAIDEEITQLEEKVAQLRRDTAPPKRDDED